MAEIKAYGRPDIIYRFRTLSDDTIDREIEAITKRYVFCPLYSEMNDPMEGNHRESAMLKESRNYGRSIAEVRAALDKFGIASFSESKAHEPMWAYYAGNFEGICIGYGMKALLANLPASCEMVKMTYNEQAPILIKNFETAANRAKMILSCKSIKWAGEREWRLIRPERGAAGYRKAECARAVYLGSRIKPEHKRKIMSALAKTEIKIYQMNIDTYDVSFTKLRPAAPKRIYLKLPAKPSPLAPKK